MANSTSKQAVPATVSKLKITSNKEKGKTVNLIDGLVRLMYYESILQDSIKASIIFSDAGNAIEGKSVSEGLPLVGTEDFKLEMKDNNNEKLKVNMVVNSMTPLYLSLIHI